MMNKNFDTVGYIHKKIDENPDYVRVTYYEIIVKENLPKEQENEFLEQAREIFEDEGFKVYFSGAKYTYENAYRSVQSNELIVAVREDEN